MIAIIKTLVKVLLTYFYNGSQIIRFSKFGIGSTIAAGLQVHGPTGINIAQKVRIGRFARLSCYATKYQNGSIYIDKGCYIGDFFSVLTADTVMIRENVLIASYVTILGENHGTDPEYIGGG